MTLKIILISVYSLLTLALVTMKALKIGNRRRGVVKMLTAYMFVGIGIYGCVISGGRLHVLLAVGLFLASLGDLLLVFMDNHKCFLAGVFSFTFASIVLSVYATLYFSWSTLYFGWALLPFAVISIANILGQTRKLYSFGKDIVYLNFYTVCVGLCGSLGITIACGVGTLQAALFGAGCFMYMCSDVCLGLYLLKFRHRALDIINSLLYFPGMLLVALSLVF